MATSKPPKSLLSKIAQMFGESADPVALDNDAPQDLATQDEAKALKEHAKRKHRDDTIRRREFDHLRPLLRKKQSLENATPMSGATRPSVFRASTSVGTEDRAETLKKIEFIEAHIVGSWAAMRMTQKDNRPPANVPLVRLTDVVPPRAAASDAAQTRPQDDLDLDFTQVHLEPAMATLPHTTAPKEEPDEPVSSGASNQASVREDAGLGALESQLRDAAILFSDGDIAATEAQLKGPLQVGGLEPELTDAMVSALCDLYRYTGQQEKFNATAMEHAEQFGRSPPEWFSLPEVLAQRGDTQPRSNLAHGAGQRDIHWESPRQLQVQDLATFQQNASDKNIGWHLNWAPLIELQADAAPILAALFDTWCAAPVDLHWRGVDALLAALQRHTVAVAADTDTDPVWWRLHMDALCILGEHDAFEELALDYCTVYEVSPPSWKVALCSLHQDQGAEPAADISQVSAAVSVLPTHEYAQHRNFTLVGDIVGEFSVQLESLAGACNFAEHVCVDCGHIGRVDFAAAGSLLNLVLQSSAHGSTLQFVQVPRLVGVFFKMLGIDRYAQVLNRTH